MFNTKGHRTLSTLHREAPADLDQVIGDHAESDPAFQAVESSLAATTQSMAALELMRPSLPVLHLWPARNQRCFCHVRHSSLRVLRLGIATRFPPMV